jgi:hypothetical protein
MRINETLLNDSVRKQVRVKKGLAKRICYSSQYFAIRYHNCENIIIQ